MQGFACNGGRHLTNQVAAKLMWLLNMLVCQFGVLFWMAKVL